MKIQTAATLLALQEAFQTVGMMENQLLAYVHHTDPKKQKVSGNSNSLQNLYNDATTF